MARRAKAKALELAPDAANAMVERLGEDPAALDQALDQLGVALLGLLEYFQANARARAVLGDHGLGVLEDRPGQPGRERAHTQCRHGGKGAFGKAEEVTVKLAKDVQVHKGKFDADCVSCSDPSSPTRKPAG